MPTIAMNRVVKNNIIWFRVIPYCIRVPKRIEQFKELLSSSINTHSTKSKAASASAVSFGDDHLDVIMIANAIGIIKDPSH
jgi:hypothetical protein